MSRIKIDKVVSVLPNPLVPDTVYAIRSGAGFDLYFSDVTGAIAHPLNSQKFLPPEQIWGQFLLDPNEFNAWGQIGYGDNTNSQDLGNVGAEITRLAGGIMYPFDVQLLSFKAFHRNSNANAQAWGWRLARQVKNGGSNTVSFNDIIRECTGAGATAVAPRDYGNNTTQYTNIDLSATATVPAGEVIILGVEAPTANTTNYYVQVFGGYLYLERV